jgi:hypothetical protein
MQSLVDQLVSPGSPLPPLCGYANNFVGCNIPGTDYYVSMQTPSPLCVTCEAERSLLVSLQRRDVGTFFARIFGQDNWNIRQTSVAGITYQARYAVITLRPPKSGHPDQNDQNISVDGSGSSLTVTNGDIGTNTNLVSSGTVALDDGFRVDHYDKPQEWTSPPLGHPTNSLIQDPMYVIPDKTTVPSTLRYNTLAEADLDDAACQPIVDSIDYTVTLPTSQVVADLDTAADDVTCYAPGVYDVELEGVNGEFIILTPGVYFLNRGVNLDSNYLIGGWEAGAPGVALVFRECNPGGAVGCALKGQAAHSIILNAGDQFPGDPTATPAAPAETWNGIQVVTNGINPNEIGLTLIVEKDPVCVVAAFEPNPNCSPPKNNTLTLAGGPGLFLAGVQYAPTDNVVFGGSSSAEGFVGQIVSWTVKYAGGTDVRQFYPGGEGNGILRLDAACSGAGTNSMNNADCHP